MALLVSLKCREELLGFIMVEMGREGRNGKVPNPKGQLSSSSPLTTVICSNVDSMALLRSQKRREALLDFKTVKMGKEGRNNKVPKPKGKLEMQREGRNSKVAMPTMALQLSLKCREELLVFITVEMGREGKSSKVPKPKG